MVARQTRSMPRCYPIQSPLQYEILDHSSGHGRIVELSSHLVRFECNGTLPEGVAIRLILMWPARLPDGTDLNLWIKGVVIGRVWGEIEVRVVSYEFRTRSAHLSSLDRPALGTSTRGLNLMTRAVPRIRSIVPNENPL